MKIRPIDVVIGSVIVMAYITLVLALVFLSDT